MKGGNWLPALIGFSGVVATVLLWHALVALERAQIGHTIQLASASVRSDVSSDMQSLILGLVRTAKILELMQPEEKNFRSYAELYISHQRGCDAVVWLDPRLRPIWVTPAPDATITRATSFALQTPQKSALDLARTTHQATVTPAFEEGRFLLLNVPVYRKGNFAGFVAALFRVPDLLDTVLDDHAGLGYSIEIKDRRELVYTLANSSHELEGKWSVSENLELPGVTWNLRVWPNPPLLASLKSRAPEVMLISGLAVVFLLVITAQLAGTARRRAEQIELANDRLLSLQDEERRRIARELHETFAQDLYAVSMKLALARSLFEANDADAVNVVTSATELTNQCLVELRTLAYLLHPPSLEYLGLAAAVSNYVRGFSERSGISVSLEIPADLAPLPQEVQTAVFRIVQEALTNVHRHSGSRTATIRVHKSEDEIGLEIADAGRGIRPELRGRDDAGPVGAGVGIDGMRERARRLGGAMHIFSSSQGTTVKVVLPTAPADMRV